jgi:hypothetical protein
LVVMDSFCRCGHGKVAVMGLHTLVFLKPGLSYFCE